MLHQKMGEQSSTTWEELEKRLSDIVEQIAEIQCQIELVDTPRIYAPHQILVTDELGQIVDSGISPFMIMKMHASLLQMAGILRAFFLVD